RSGDWRLLNNIEEQFEGNEKQLKILPLETNFRSEHNIIEFNNAFFTKATEILCDRMKDEYPEYARELRQAYSDVVQKTSPYRKEKHGLVSIKLLDKKTEGGYDNATMAQIADTIHSLEEHGAKQSNIAILVRQNKYIPVIARYFLDHHSDIDLVSDEAFQLQASLAVNIIINAMRVIANRLDDISVANLAKMYQRHIVQVNTSQNDSDLLLVGVDKAALLPERFTNNIEALQTMPLQELAETIYDIFSLSTLSRQSAYICSFYDHLSRFANDKANDINKFLREWDETLCTKTIKSSEIEGVRILSIHASKGLEYDHVIIPFCDWLMEIQGDTLWCTPKEEPYNELPLVPVKNYSKQLKGTIYEDDYMHEHLQNIVDNLNLLYVAFTRASANLFVIGQSGQADGYRSKLIEECLEGMTEMAAPHSTAQDFTIGTLYIPQEKESKATDNVLLQASRSLPVEIVSHESPAEFRQSNASTRFIEGEEDDAESQTYLKTGSILHEIFSTIRTTADIEPTLTRLQMDGILYDDEITNERITTLLRKRLNDKRIAEWFSDKWTLLNECTILKWDEQQKKAIDRRPDRVMTDGQQTIVVDFKFGKPFEKYAEQVKEYMSLLQEMDYPDIKGYIWYVYSNRIEEIIAFSD
ncbi:MAG: DNA helicase UvrD, partial [Prevotella sp.]|nr:DNA helicase UvrD [Prevotella sp.]